MNWYRGFRLHYWTLGSQHWQAEQHGVTMNAQSLESLTRVIDQHIQDRADYLHARQNGI